MKTSNILAKSLFVVGAMSLCFWSTACGDDEAAPAPKTKKAARKPAPKKGPQGDASKAGIAGYQKIPEDHRRELSAKDFRIDKSGDENRDPFHSFVFFPNARIDGDDVVKVTNVCDRAEWVASDISISSMNLVGIVTHGTKGWAQFTDSTGMGHIVGRSECLGKEKAMVEQIGDSFVRLRVIPEAAPGAATPPPQLKDYSLSPEELQLKE